VILKRAVVLVTSWRCVLGRPHASVVLQGGMGRCVHESKADVISMPGKCFLMDFNDFLDVLGGSRTDEVPMSSWMLLFQCKSLRYHLVVFMGAFPSVLWSSQNEHRTPTGGGTAVAGLQ
jgi:hypothetical protein